MQMECAETVLLSDGLWKQRFAADPHVFGRRITLDDAPATVVGVMPPSFDFGWCLRPARTWICTFPFPLTPETDGGETLLRLWGRLKAGATVASAQAEATILGDHISKEQPILATD